jgi:hypothetical protein
MEDLSLQQLLVKYGIDQNTAQRLQNDIIGSDILNLVNSLQLDNRQQAVRLANPILQKYGVTISENLMIKRVAAIEWLKELKESKSVEDRLLILEGYNYYTYLDATLGEQLTDWLESNKVEFLTNGDGHFHVKCEDRDHAYKVGRAISGIVRKQRLVRDSQVSKAGQTEMNEKQDIKARINQAKSKLANMKPRDPTALAAARMQAKNGGPMDAQRKIDQKDQYGRKAKYKDKGKWDEEIDFKIGEKVIYRDQYAIINSLSKGNQINLVMDGNLSWVDKRDVSRLDETISALAPIAPLFRLRELAGLPPAPKSDMINPLGSGAIASRFDDPDDDISASLLDDDGMDSDDGGMTDAPVAPNADGPMLPGVSAGMSPGMPVVTSGGDTGCSEAMNMIKDHLNNIQLQLPEIRLSEYKTVVAQLQSLAQQVQFMGKDYLGERKK